MNVCLIPARGGSKRIPRKNIRDFRGQPMISWSITTAIDSGCFDKVIVSTDDEEISKISADYGADVPFCRPPELSDDYSTTQDVVLHALHWFKDQSISVEALCCLYATAPLVCARDLSNAQEILNISASDFFVFAATTFPFPIQRAIRIGPSGISTMLHPEFFNTRSQDLEELYHDAGQFYWARPSAWLNAQNIFDRGRPVVLPRWRVQDIDTEEDWIHAELLHRLLEEKG